MLVHRNLPLIGKRSFSAIAKDLTAKHIVPSYGRFDLTLSHGKGMYVWDITGKKYLDVGGGIAVNSLGHAHPGLVAAAHDQAQKLIHISNLYYSQPAADLASRLTELFGGSGKVFFCNSGAEANEAMYKLARKFGNDSDLEASRYEIITTINSFHGRTLGGISATGQDKIKKGFYPMIEGFRHVAYNDLDAMAAAIGPKTCAIMLEGIQGEGGILAADPGYLLGLRQLCNEKNLLLLMDGVQCGHFRSGRFQSYQRILEDVAGGSDFLPDAVSMAKSLGGGYPIGATWVAPQHQDLLSAGYHGTTYGGNPVACAAALQVLKVVEDEGLEQNTREMGILLQHGLNDIASLFPNVIKSIRGMGLMIGIEVSNEAYPFTDSPAGALVADLHKNGVLTVPSGQTILRLLPPLNITTAEVTELLQVIEAVCADLSEDDPEASEEALKALKEKFEI